MMIIIYDINRMERDDLPIDIKEDKLRFAK